MKMHLTARVPNEGARKLAQWIMSVPGGIVEAARAIGTSPEWLQRMVEGEMVPGLTVGTRMAAWLSIRARDFAARPAGGWFDVIEPLAKAA